MYSKEGRQQGSRNLNSSNYNIIMRNKEDHNQIWSIEEIKVAK